MSSDIRNSDRLHAILTGVETPFSRTNLRELKTSLPKAVSDTTDELTLEPSRTEIFTGHLYSQIKARCPTCSGPLILRSPAFMTNAVYATANCEYCSWTGEATYRLIDLMEFDENTQTGPFPEIPFHSAVRRGQHHPTYVPFGGRNGRQG